MADSIKSQFLHKVTSRYGTLTKLRNSNSLFQFPNSSIRLYIRYSRVHAGGRTFYGLREQDLQQLEGHSSILALLWDGQTEPLLVPFSEYEDVFQSILPATDGQYKAQVYLDEDGTELYVARAGRFNVEGYFGWHKLDALVDSPSAMPTPQFSHTEMQGLVGAIGAIKRYDVWIPPNDRSRLDWSVMDPYTCREMLPGGFESVDRILQEVDVIWVRRGSNDLRALFEIEHSTPIYSGLLRFNDVHLVVPRLRPRFSIVARNERQLSFSRQLSRPTFRASGLSELCTFLEYSDVFQWYQSVCQTRGILLRSSDQCRSRNPANQVDAAADVKWHRLLRGRAAQHLPRRQGQPAGSAAHYRG